MRILAFLVVFLAVSAFASALPPNVESFRSDFVQTVSTEDGGKISYFGSIEAKIPDLAKWAYVRPLKKDIYVRGKEVIVYEPTLDQATVTRLKKKTDFLSMLKNAVPQKDGRYLSKINDVSYFLTFRDDKPFLLEFRDEFDNEVRIEFVNPVLNQKLSDSDFAFNPPADTDVIHR